MSKKKIALIQGGLGAEREVSLSTGAAFAAALDELGHDYQVIDAKEDLPAQLAAVKVDLALIALHGKYAEDGVVQGLCEYLKIPYSGSGVLASALCMDKVLSKQIYVQNDIPTALFQVIDLHQVAAEEVECNLEYPVVVKPSREGSSVGIHIVKAPEQLLAAIKDAGQYDHYILIEEYIAGMEATVPLLNGKALTAIEIIPKVDFYTYENKYTKGKTEYILPARIPADKMQFLKQVSERLFEIFRLRAYARVDFRIDENFNPYVMEVNTLPGCTQTSLLPKSAAHDGISFAQVIQTLIDTASLDYQGLK